MRHNKEIDILPIVNIEINLEGDSSKDEYIIFNRRKLFRNMLKFNTLIVRKQ